MCLFQTLPCFRVLGKKRAVLKKCLLLPVFAKSGSFFPRVIWWYFARIKWRKALCGVAYFISAEKVFYSVIIWEQERCSGESTRLPPKTTWPWLESWRWRHMWVKFVVSSPLLREIFVRFSPFLKNQHFKIPIRSETRGHVWASSWELLRS